MAGDDLYGRLSRSESHPIARWAEEDLLNPPPDTNDPAVPRDDDDGAAKARRQRILTVVTVGAAIVVGALFFTAGGGGSSAPTTPATTASTPTVGVVTSGPPGPTAPTVSVVESTAIGADALAIGSSGTFSTADGSGVVTVRGAQWRETADSASGFLPVIEVEIQVTAGHWVTHPFNFGLQGARGEVYPVLAGAVEDQLADGQLLDSGGAASGFVTFDAPRQPFTLVFAGPDGKALLTWRMPE